ncbi:MAG: HDIG domain-containing metalloprotein [Thermoplasmatota archaeon]
MNSRDDWVDLPHVEVLRLGHRPDRDKRITTHVALVARALGAKAILVDRKDIGLERTIERVNEQFGGEFTVHTGVSMKGILGRWGGTIVHLTMYGMPLDEAVREIPSEEKVLVVVGAEKVPREVYDLAHFNVSVSNQPHSEVSALSLFLDHLFKGRELHHDIIKGEMTIIPNRRGKTVISSRNGEGEMVAADPFSRNWPPLPDRNECMEILAEVGCSKAVIDHVREVRDLGLEMVEASMSKDPDRFLDIDMKLLEAGLLLHDMGRSITHSIGHIKHGVVLARKLGLDERIVSMIHNHIGAGVTAEEAAGLGLSREDHIPSTLMERIVCHADNLTGERKRRSLEKAVDRLRAKGAHAAAERMIKLHLGLERELGIDIDALVDRKSPR